MSEVNFSYFLMELTAGVTGKLSTEIEVFTGKSQTGMLPYWSKFKIIP